MGTLYRYHHLGIPTADDVAGGTYLPHLKMTVSDDTATPYGIQWMRFDEDCPLPHLVKRVPHVAFEVDDLKAAIRGKKGSSGFPVGGIRAQTCVSGAVSEGLGWHYSRTLGVSPYNCI